MNIDLWEFSVQRAFVPKLMNRLTLSEHCACQSLLYFSVPEKGCRLALPVDCSGNCCISLLCFVTQFQKEKTPRPPMSVVG